MRTKELVERMLQGDRRAMAKLITLVESNFGKAKQVAKLLLPHLGRAQVVGITGFPGSGKSTLINKLIGELRGRGKTVGVIMVDATSPYSGGALLGDRVRMQEHSGNQGVFIRSMASKGAPGGLARATGDVIKILDAFGKDLVLIETVGAGQAEVEVTRIADTVVVVTQPGLGDDIQALKAGISEIADIFVLNKADLFGAERALSELEFVLGLGEEGEWKPPVIKTVALTGEGVPKLLDEIFKHMEYLKSSGLLEQRRRKRMEAEVLEALNQGFELAIKGLRERVEFKSLLDQVAKGRLDPYSAAEALMRIYLEGEKEG